MNDVILFVFMLLKFLDLIMYGIKWMWFVCLCVILFIIYVGGSYWYNDDMLCGVFVRICYN